MDMLIWRQLFSNACTNRRTTPDVTPRIHNIKGAISPPTYGAVALRYTLRRFEPSTIQTSLRRFEGELYTVQRKSINLVSLIIIFKSDIQLKFIALYVHMQAYHLVAA